MKKEKERMGKKKKEREKEKKEERDVGTTGCLGTCVYVHVCVS